MGYGFIFVWGKSSWELPFRCWLTVSTHLLAPLVLGASLIKCFTAQRLQTCTSFCHFFCQFQNKIIFSKVQFYSFMGENPLLQVAKRKRNVKEAVVPGLGFYEISQHYIKQHCQSKCKISLKLFQIIYTLAAFCYLAMLLWPRRSMRRWVLVTKLLWAWARWGVAASELRAKKRANDMKNKVRCSYIRRKTWQVRGDIFVRCWGSQPVFCCMCFMIANVNKARTSGTDWGSLWCYFLTFLAEPGGNTCFNTHWTALSLD